MKKGLLVGFESAQGYWRLVGERLAAANAASETRRPLLIRILFERGEGIDLTPLPRRTRMTTAPEQVDAPTVARLRSLLPELGEVLHLCVSRQAARRFVSGGACHLMTGAYPPGSFHETAEGVLLASPELMFLQMARRLDEDLLVAYGYELCGYFARIGSACGSVICPQLTTVARIAGYLERLERLRQERGEGMPWGLERARRALGHVRDGAASPEEAVTSMLLTLPRARGGYGLPTARLNATVRLGARASELFGIDEFVYDLSWEERRTVVEFQGVQQKERSRGSFDRRKGNVLGADDWKVVEVDRAMLNRAELMDEVAKSVSRALRLRWRRADVKTATRRLRLRNKLLRYLDER